MALSTNRLIKVNLTINPLAAAARGFGTLLVVGDSDVISPSERYRAYTNVNDVASDFGLDAPEYKAAALYYAQSPTPTNLMIGRWNREATSSELNGAILTAEEQSLDSWAAISDGKFAYTLNNSTVNIEHLDFTGVGSMSGVAGVISDALGGALTCEWGSDGRFILRTTAKGKDVVLGYCSDAPEQTNVAAMLGLKDGTPTAGTDLIPSVPAITALPATLVGTTADLETLKRVTDGSFKITVNGTPLEVPSVDLSGCESLEAVAELLSGKLSAGATVSVDSDHFVVSSKLTGAATSVGKAEAGPKTNVDVAAKAGKLIGTAADLETLKQVTDGSFKIDIDGEEVSVTKQNYSEVNSLEDIAGKLNTAFSGSASVSVAEGAFIITSATTGAASTVGLATAGEQTTAPVAATAGYYTCAAISNEGTQLETLKLQTAGGLSITVDSGGAVEISNVNLSTITSIGDAVPLINNALSTATVGAVCRYDESAKTFIFTSNSTGASSSVSVAEAGTSTGMLAALGGAGTSTPGTAAVIGTDTDLGTKLGLSAGTPELGADAIVGTDTDLGTKLGLSEGTQTTGRDYVPEVPEVPATSGYYTGTRAQSLANIKEVKDGCFSISVDGSVDTVLRELDFSGITTLSDVAAVIGAGLSNARVTAEGDHLVLTSTRTGVTSSVSAAKDIELTERNIATKLKLTRETASSLAAGYDAESAVEALQVFCDKTAAWYAAMFAAGKMPSDDQLYECATFIEANTDTTHILGITATDTRVLDKEYSDDIASRCCEAGFNRTCIQYSENPYAIASLFGRAFTVDFNGSMTTITLMYKTEPSVVAEELTETQAQTLADKRCNVYVNYNNDTAILQNGVMCGDYWFDERHGSDWLKDYVQNNVWNYVYGRATKVPQDDAGMNQVIAVINDSLIQAKQNGFIGAGTWNGDGFGQLATGQYMPDGFYVYAPPMATQTQADRDARISVPIQVAAKLLGAIHTFDVAITLNR